MKSPKQWLCRTAALVALFALVAALRPEPAQGSLHWRQPRKEQIRVRLVALAWTHPRSSFFPSEEVFVADKELTAGELRLVKLVYGFLPYQPRLSESGFDYSTLHEIRAVRDPSCDETLRQLMADERDHQQRALVYSEDSPKVDLDRRRMPLPCYLTSADDYTKAIYTRAFHRRVRRAKQEFMCASAYFAQFLCPQRLEALSLVVAHFRDRPGKPINHEGHEVSRRL
jgi:hypothetical protein